MSRNVFNGMFPQERPLSLGGHVESQGNKKLSFFTASLTLNSRLTEASRAKTKLFILLRLNMARQRSIEAFNCSAHSLGSW